MDNTQPGVSELASATPGKNHQKSPTLKGLHNQGQTLSYVSPSGKAVWGDSFPRVARYALTLGYILCFPFGE
jgi:hypothetical protein